MEMKPTLPVNNAVVPKQDRLTMGMGCPLGTSILHMMWFVLLVNYLLICRSRACLESSGIMPPRTLFC